MNNATSQAVSQLFGCAGIALALLALPASAQSNDPIKIGVTAKAAPVYDPVAWAGA